MSEHKLKREDDAPTVEVTESGAPSSSIGSYRLLQKVGEGGMGEVWLAEQTSPVRRRVALKLLKAGMDTAQVTARFQAERQALALMDHPGIARVFDAGVTPQGRPYFAMEYVAGEAITSYCERHRVSHLDRLRIFLEVCEAVHHAHQKGIIHRDLKPSNILVSLQDGRPAPKVIDFGVAKATTTQLSERTLFTEIGVLVGTVEYMSPEQADLTGLDIDTRSDVYSLGVILYELLTGVLPLDSKVLRDRGLEEMRRAIRETDPPRPSTRVRQLAATLEPQANGRGSDPRRLATQLRGDLDWIVMKAMAKERARRYAAASELAADLRRHLADEPVTAGPTSAWYHARKFIVRHRFGAATAASIVALLVALVVTMVIQAQRVGTERDRANREAEAARQVAGFLTDLFKVSDPAEARGDTLTARQILDKGSLKIDQTLSGQPDLQSRLQATIGAVYIGLGMYKEAESLLERAVKNAEQTYGADHVDTLKTLSALADVYWYQSRYREAEPLYVRVMTGRSKALGAEHADTLKAQFDLASLYAQEKRWQEAERLQQQTLTQQRSVLGDEHLDTLMSISNLASMYETQKRYDEAATLGEELLRVQRRALGADHPSTLISLGNLGNVYYARGEYAKAETIYRECLNAKRRVLGVEHENTALTENQLAQLYVKTGRHAEAEPLALHAYEIAVKTFGATHGRAHAVARVLVRLYQTWGKNELAASWQTRLPVTTSVQPR